MAFTEIVWIAVNFGTDIHGVHGEEKNLQYYIDWHKIVHNIPCSTTMRVTFVVLSDAA